MPLAWSNEDPRLKYTNTSGVNIIIVRPSAAGQGQLESGVASVETHHGWNVWTSFENHRLIDAGEKWDPDWKWIELGG